MKFSVAAAQCTAAMVLMGVPAICKRHADAIFLREIADLFRFENAATGGQVGMNYIHRMRLQQGQETLP